MSSVEMIPPILQKKDKVSVGLKMLTWSLREKVNNNQEYSMIDNDVSLYTDPSNPAHMNFEEAKLLQRIAEMETRLQQIRGNMEKEQSQFGDRQQFYY